MNEQVIPLTELAIPDILAEQLERFTHDSIHAEKLMDLDPSMAAERLKSLEGKQVIAGDFGGDKALIKLFKLVDGTLQPDDTFEKYVQSTGGEGYLAALEETVEFIGASEIPVGISWGAPLDGTRPLYHPKADIFLKELGEKYDGDFAKLLPSLKACINDGPAGLIAGALGVSRTMDVDNILFPINGGGFGMAVLKDGTIYATEAGHVEGVDALNKYNQDDICGVYGNSYVCIERYGANKVGIEAQWQSQKGAYMRARDIEDRYKEGDELARELYDNSALAIAHLIAGTAKAFEIDLTSPKTAVVCHGGAFNFPSYGDRVSQILDNAGQKPQLFLSKNFIASGSNACLEGAAYTALLS